MRAYAYTNRKCAHTWIFIFIWHLVRAKTAVCVCEHEPNRSCVIRIIVIIPHVCNKAEKREKTKCYIKKVYHRYHTSIYICGVARASASTPLPLAEWFIFGIVWCYCITHSSVSTVTAIYRAEVSFSSSFNVQCREPKILLPFDNGHPRQTFILDAKKMLHMHV